MADDVKGPPSNTASVSLIGRQAVQEIIAVNNDRHG
jgi:hypothetical protein